jgi:hypothetical protein
MTQSADGNATPEQQIEWLQNELNDAHLVIGRQQVQLLQLQQATAALQRRIQEQETTNVGR